MDSQHLNQSADHIIVIQLLMQQVELCQKVDHIDDVEQNFQEERVIFLLIVRLQELDRRLQYVIVLPIAFDQHVVVRLLHYE